MVYEISHEAPQVLLLGFPVTHVAPICGFRISVTSARAAFSFSASLLSASPSASSTICTSVLTCICAHSLSDTLTAILLCHRGCVCRSTQMPQGYHRRRSVPLHGHEAAKHCSQRTNSKQGPRGPIKPVLSSDHYMVTNSCDCPQPLDRQGKSRSSGACGSAR